MLTHVFLICSHLVNLFGGFPSQDITTAELALGEIMQVWSVRKCKTYKKIVKITSRYNLNGQRRRKDICILYADLVYKECRKQEMLFSLVH